jgi:hypothetical protein
MSILQKIKDDQLQARKAKEELRSKVLTVLLGEASRPGKDNGNRESTDAEVIAVIKKFIKNNQENIENTPETSNLHQTSKMEIELLEPYLPKQLDETEIRNVIESYIAELDDKAMKQMGKVMGQLKADHDGLYDGGVASKLVKELLA